LPGYVEIAVGPVTRALDRGFSRLTRVSPSKEAVKTAATGDTVFNVIVLVITAGLLVAAIGFVLSGVGIEEVLHAAVLGLATGGRVLALITFSTLVWTPIGVVIGFNPKLARLSQPLVQILASFPANFRFPFATLAFIRLGVSQRRCSSMGTSLSPIDR
jgi:NitT/TauT family transport system permease protein